MVAQNATIIIRANQDNIIFEAFELSPLSEAVITSKGRLKRHFPQTAVAVPMHTFDQDDFQSTLSMTIAKMSCQPVREMKPHGLKAEEPDEEDRETSSPQIVTELLMSFLRANGTPIQVSGTWKRTREEVLWANKNKLPWRRSPM